MSSGNPNKPEGDNRPKIKLSLKKAGDDAAEPSNESASSSESTPPVQEGTGSRARLSLKLNTSGGDSPPPATEAQKSAKSQQAIPAMISLKGGKQPAVSPPSETVSPTSKAASASAPKPPPPKPVIGAVPPKTNKESLAAKRAEAKSGDRVISPGVTSTPFSGASEPPPMRLAKKAKEEEAAKSEDQRQTGEVHPAKQRKAWSPEDERKGRPSLSLDKTKAPWADGKQAKHVENDPFSFVSERSVTRGPFVDSEGTFIDPGDLEGPVANNDVYDDELEDAEEFPEPEAEKPAGGLIAAAKKQAGGAPKKQGIPAKVDPASSGDQAPMIKGTRPSLGAGAKKDDQQAGLVGAALSRAPFKNKPPEPTDPGQGPMIKVTAKKRKSLPQSKGLPTKGKPSPLIAGTNKRAKAAPPPARKKANNKPVKKTEKPSSSGGGGTALFVVTLVAAIIGVAMFFIFSGKTDKSSAPEVITSEPTRTEGMIWTESQIKVTSLAPKPESTPTPITATDSGPTPINLEPEKPEAPAVPVNPVVMRFLNTIDIKAVRTGANAKLVTEMGTYSIGDVVYSEYGVRFVGVSPESESIQFKDERGSVYNLNY